MSDSHPSITGIPLVFGGNVFSWTIDRDKSFEVLDAYYEAGGRMVDSAEVYGRQPSGERGHQAEAILGEWLESRGVRKDMRIATKTGLDGPGALAPARVAHALDASLDRLRTDYVDLYYAHRDDEATPLEDAVAAFDAVYQSKMARELGSSNYSTSRLAAIMDTAEKMGAQPFTIAQPEYNLVSRESYEGAMQDLCVSRGVGVLPFFGLASGFLTGKYSSADDWKDSQREGVLNRYDSERNWNVLSALNEVAKDTGETHAVVALAWLNAQPGVLAPIASATSVEQLNELVRAASFSLTEDQLARLDEAGKAEA